MKTTEDQLHELTHRVAALESLVQDLLTGSAKAKRSASSKKGNVSWNELLDAGMSGDVATDFLAHRDQLKAPLTHTAFKSIEREARKAGICLDTAATLMMNRGWRGLQAEWVPRQVLDKGRGDAAFLQSLRHSRSAA